MKKVLILGVNGFIGHHLSNRIRRRDECGGVCGKVWHGKI